MVKREARQKRVKKKALAKKGLKKILKKEEDFERNERGSVVTTFLFIFLFIFLIIVLLYLIYLVYMNIPGEPELGEVVIGSNPQINLNETPLYAVKQFYPNIKFNHNQISYRIEKACNDEKRERMTDAFKIVSDEVSSISFTEVSKNPDIEVSCSQESLDIDEDYFIAGEGGAKEIIQTGKYNVITEGIILLYDAEKSKTAKCEYPNVELHELMHVFGFDHSADKNSIMHPYLERCEQVLDKNIISKLRETYSTENLPDLYFDKVEAVKKGRYLDFNLTIKNSGLVNAEKVSFSILDQGKLVQDREIGEGLENIAYGGGILIAITGLKLLNRDSEEVHFILDRENKIKEMDEQNNRVAVNF